MKKYHAKEYETSRMLKREKYAGRTDITGSNAEQRKLPVEDNQTKLIMLVQ